MKRGIDWPHCEAVRPAWAYAPVAGVKNLLVKLASIAACCGVTHEQTQLGAAVNQFSRSSGGDGSDGKTGSMVVHTSSTKVGVGRRVGG
jgi:hypothetical protein